ncbi:hypothetical protein LTR97_002488 [Elasticomyces elasticus]|uniref:Amidase domain-containing protein n=1 Tax=Elasticomyces elasticus TaxID=574655 RepID=A0AAN8A5H6_9PEZI|nr:hypothetical protein LTR97_002488 [Elasticomyces elasticus]
MGKLGPAWQAAVHTKQRDLWSNLPQGWRIEDEVVTRSNGINSNVIEVVPTYLSPAEIHITNLSVRQLLEGLCIGDITAQEVLSAFAHRAIVAHQFTRCLSEMNFDAALKRARELDAYWQEHRCAVGPLHGLPVSLMDRFHVSGLDSACGFASWVGTKRTSDDEGEGALIALRGSPLGFGTDVAGSVRIPSSFNGLWALKCSEGRLPYSGLATVLSGMPVASGSIGIMSADLAGVSTAFKCLLASRPWVSDINTLELPWRQDKFDAIRRRMRSDGATDGRLVIGVMRSDGHVMPQPPLLRAIDFTVQALQHCGYDIVEWSPPPHAPAIHNLFEIFGSTSAQEARHAIDASGEPPVAQIKGWYDNDNVPANSTADFWRLCGQRNNYCAQYAAYWKSTSSLSRSGRIPDGIILPVAPSTAVRSGDFHYYGYSAIANVLDYVSGVIPVTVGHKLMDVMDPGRPIASDLDKKVKMSFNSNDAHNMPVGIQVVCPRLQEEQVLGLMEAISEALGQAA